MAEMTMRERMTAVLRGGEFDRVPFCQYPRVVGPHEDVWELVGRENVGLLANCKPFRIESPGCELVEEEIERDGLSGFRTTLRTPEGELFQEKLREPALGTAATRRHYVQTVDDYRVVNAYLRSLTIEPDLEGYVRFVEQIGEDGVCPIWLCRTPYQQLWIQWVELQDLCFHMVDAPEVLSGTLDLLATESRRMCDAAAEICHGTDVPYVDFPDNLTAPAIGERYFRQHCAPFYSYMAELLDGTGTLVCSHTDGDLKPLWSALSETGLGGLESFTPPPDGDTRVADVVEMWPEMRMLMNFPSSVHLAAPEVVYETAVQLLREGGASGRLWIQISENIPPGLWKRSYPEILRAVRDFGASVGG